MRFTKKILAAQLMIMGTVVSCNATAGITIAAATTAPVVQPVQAKNPVAEPKAQESHAPAAKERVFVDLDDEVDRAVEEVVRVKQIGVPKGQINMVKGFGRDVTLREALKQTMPEDFLVFQVGNVDFQKRLSWRGGASWLTVLNNIGNTADLMFTVDWTHKEVTVSGGSAALNKTATKAGKRANESFGGQVNTIQRGETLRSAVERLAKTVGWEVAWQAKETNYNIDIPITLKGELIGPGNALDQLIAAYRDADEPLEIKFMNGNRTIQIDHMSFQQRGAK